MNVNKILLVAMLFFTGQVFATNVDEWVYESTKGDLKPTPGCKDKEVAAKKASSGYRFKKHATVLCNGKGYGWGLAEVIDKGSLVCEPCEGEYEDEEKYRCYMKDVVVKCKQVVR